MLNEAGKGAITLSSSVTTSSEDKESEAPELYKSMKLQTPPPPITASYDNQLSVSQHKLPKRSSHDGRPPKSGEGIALERLKVAVLAMDPSQLIARLNQIQTEKDGLVHDILARQQEMQKQLFDELFATQQNLDAQNDIIMERLLTMDKYKTDRLD